MPAEERAGRRTLPALQRPLRASRHRRSPTVEPSPRTTMPLARLLASRPTVRTIPTRALAAALLAAVACRGGEQPTAQRAADSTAADAAAEDPFAGDTGGLARYLPPSAADSARRAQLFASIT